VQPIFSKPLTWTLVLLLCHVAAGQQNPNGRLPVMGHAKPYLFLIRDPQVHDDLGLSALQRRVVGTLNDELDSDLWSMRNKSAEHIDATIRKATATAKARLATILTSQQQERLPQIELWTLGTRAFLLDGLPGQLQLSETQLSEIRATINKTQEAINALIERIRSGESGDALRDKGRPLWTQTQKDIAELLTDEQREKWRALLGERIEVSKLGYVKFKAPELHGEGGWINSPSLTLRQLKGKVVALHFYAFG
jgi:hypothetical protein